MPNLVTKTKIFEGPKKAIFHFYFESDGNEGELTNYVLIDAAQDFEPSETFRLQYTITKIWHGQAVYDSILKFNALVPTPAWVLVPDSDNHICFTHFGGLKDRSGVEHDGKLLISTNGFATAGSVGTLIIEVKKD